MVPARVRVDSQRIYTREQKVGSHRTVTRCETVAQRERAHEQTLDAVQRNQGASLPREQNSL